MYDLAGRDDRRFSPACWRVRLTLAHKGLDCAARPTRFVEIAAIGDGSHKTVPVIVDGARTIADSWVIVEYVEAAWPDRPSVFGGLAGKSYARFVQGWSETQVAPAALRMIALDLFDHIDPTDRDYFRASREKRLGMKLEEVPGDREAKLPAFRALLEPLRRVVAQQPFLGGDAPIYADYVAAGTFAWARATSPFRLLAADDPVAAWFGRIKALHGGLLGRSVGYD